MAAPHLCEAVISATPQKASPSSPLSTLVSALIPVRRSIRKKNNGMESINVETRECCKNIRCTSIIPKWEEKYVMPMEPKTVPCEKNKYSKTEDTALLDLRSARGGAVTAEQNDKFWRPE